MNERDTKFLIKLMGLLLCTFIMIITLVFHAENQFILRAYNRYYYKTHLMVNNNKPFSTVYHYVKNVSYSSTIPDDCFLADIDDNLKASYESDSNICHYTFYSDTSKCGGSSNCYRISDYAKEVSFIKKVDSDVKRLYVLIIFANIGVIAYFVMKSYKEQKICNR